MILYILFYFLEINANVTTSVIEKTTRKLTTNLFTEINIFPCTFRFQYQLRYFMCFIFLIVMITKTFPLIMFIE